MTLKVLVEDMDTGELQEAEVATGDYLLITHKPCYEHNVTAYANGTHVITIKGRTQ